MSNVRRTLVLNPVEPAPISMKLRSGLANEIEVEYLRQNGAPFNTDFGAQLYLIERTSGAVRQYLLPAIDVINGRARAIIPAGDIRDRNGYNVQIIGSVEGEARLIARGSASVYETEALGIIPADLIDDIDITLTYNEDAAIDVNVWKDAEKTTEYDLTGSSVTANIWSRAGGTVLAPFTVTVIDANTVRLTLTAAQVNGLPAACWWSMSVTTGAGLTTLVHGDVRINGVPAMVFTDINLLYTYVKLDTLGVPAAGECLHSNNALDILRFSIYDAEDTDRMDWLRQMGPQHTITLLTPVELLNPDLPPEEVPVVQPHVTYRAPRDDPEPPVTEPLGTKWTIISATALSGYYQFVVEPVEQSPEIGEQTFAFVK